MANHVNSKRRNLLKRALHWLHRVFLPPPLAVVNPDTGINPVLAQARERILTALLRVDAVVALFALLVVGRGYARQGRWDMIAFYLTTLVIVWIFAINRTISVKIRSWFFVSLAYILGAFDMAVFGVAEDWRLYLFSFSILAAIFLSWRAGLLATLLSAVTVGVIASQISSGRLVITASGMSSPIPNAEDIITFTVIFAMISSVIVTAVGALLRELGETSLRESRAAQLLQQERVLLERRVVDRTRELKERNGELQKALATIKTLNGLVPICAWCNSRMKDENDHWISVTEYLSEKTDAQLSHGICPDCKAKLLRVDTDPAS